MTEEPELSSLIDQARSGDRPAYVQLVERVQARVRAWAARFTDDSDEADDVAQEVLIGLQQSVHHFQSRSRFATWLFSVTRNTAREHRRLEARRSALLARHEPTGLAASPGGATTHDEHVVANLILKYFDALPPGQRRIFELVDLRGQDPAEVARQLGMSQSTVRAHLFKARRSIRTRMLELHEPLMKEFFS